MFYIISYLLHRKKRNSVVNITITALTPTTTGVTTEKAENIMVLT